ncbi:AraC family transcriptional regulator [Paenibacillus plantiphilus]|uniref:AraC family transcriptional regulator n=1 Tax=Paenibacillus plantiphilus TaxID=2905650 RepID=UPI001F2AE173|nr:AraC family transcriptional regulator [Paenibacillus plantiphilus]
MLKRPISTNIDHSRKYLFVPTEFEKSSAAWPLRIGIHENASHFHTGPRVLPYYNLIFILNGEGSFIQKSKTYHLRRNDIFCCFPQVSHEYFSNDAHPMSYMWLAFEGPHSGLLLERIGIKHCTPYQFNAANPNALDFLQTLISLAKNDFERDQDLTRLITFHQVFKALSAKVSDTDRNQVCSDEWLERAKEHMELHYSEDINIETVAQYVGIERSYFSRKFKQSYKITPMKYLQEIRVSAAKTLLRTTELNLSAIAQSIGYVDMFSFSKAFKKGAGISPNEYRSSVK